MCHRSKLTCLRDVQHPIVDLPNQTLESSYLQELCDSGDALWMGIFYIRLACPRKGHSLGARSVKVKQMISHSRPYAALATQARLDNDRLLSYSLLAAESNAHLRTFILASSAGIMSLFPLLFTPSGLYFRCSQILLFTTDSISPFEL